jgi:hypothetical protein
MCDKRAVDVKHAAFAGGGLEELAAFIVNVLIQERRHPRFR